MLNTYRRHDAVLVVCQNNEARKIEIAAVNDQAQSITGYSNEELVGADLLEILDEKSTQLLNEEIDFVHGRDDVADVLTKVRSLSIHAKAGEVHEFRLRVVRSEMVDSHPTFHLVLEDERLALENDNFKRVLKENFKGHEVIDERTGLPNRMSLMKDLEMFQFFAKKREVTACFAVLQLDNAAQLAAMMGDQVPFQVLKHLGQLCTQRLRNEDTVGLLSSGSLGLILMQITPQSARVVLNRLRWSAASMPVILDTGKRVDPKISIAFHMIGEEGPENIIVSCEQQVKTAPDDGATLHEVKI